jgi:AcrR family transcriptional regulator
MSRTVDLDTSLCMNALWLVLRMAELPLDEPRRQRHRPRIAMPPAWPPDARSSILAAMATTVAEKGFAAARVTDVIAHAGVSRRTFYAHFHDRDDCFASAYERIRKDVLALLAPAGDTAPSDVDALAVAIQRMLAHCAAWPHHAHLLLVEIVSTGPAGRQRHEQTMAELADRLVACGPWRLGDTVALGPTELAQALIGALHRLITLTLADGRHEELPALGRRLDLLSAAKGSS